MADKRGMDWRLLAIMYGLVAAAFIARSAFNAPTIPLIADTDDAMRLVVVRDLIAGQGWFDNFQYRMNTPYGAEMHWSRLADLPLAALVLLFNPLLGADSETAAAYVQPLVWLFVLLYLSGRVTLRLVGRDGLLPAFALPAVSLSVLGEFVPGRLDHHSLQILLLMVMLWCAIESLARPRFAIGAGLAAATSLGLGVEGLPSVAATILAVGLMWVSLPARADALRSFGLSLALGALFHLVIALPPERWLLPACDAISVVYVAGAVAVGAAFLALSLLPLAARSMWLRLACGIAAGLAVLAAVALLFPACLRGPYAALDPWLVEHWLDRITEARPLWQSLVDEPVYPLAIAVPPFLALVVIFVRLHRAGPNGRGAWLVYAVFLILTLAVMLVQIRASRMATSLAVPACAWLIVEARRYYLARPSLLRVAPLLMSWIGSAGVGVALVALGVVNLVPGSAVAIGDPGLKDRRQCVMPAAFVELAAMPPERVMTPIDLGAHMLAYTPHHVVAAPYHRNQAGVRDVFAFFNEPIDEARGILDRRGLSLVVVCPAMPEMRGMEAAAPDSFVRLLADDRLPPWLVETSLPNAPLRVFAVMSR
jgi:hypothetical protein